MVDEFGRLEVDGTLNDFPNYLRKNVWPPPECDLHRQYNVNETAPAPLLFVYRALSLANQPINAFAYGQMVLCSSSTPLLTL